MILVPSKNVREVIKSLEALFPGIRERLCDENDLKSSFTVIVDREVSHRRLRQVLSEDSEVHFLPVISGGT